MGQTRRIRQRYWSSFFPSSVEKVSARFELTHHA
jgi:hypothetical protein